MQEPARPSEDALIARYFAPFAGRGALDLRDDAALMAPTAGHDLVVTKDMLVAGVHFFPDDPPDIIARKALRVNLSDLAAKAAASRGFLLGLALPNDWTEAWLAAFCSGLRDDVGVFACPLLGGDTVATPGPLTVSITAFGEVPSGCMVPRTGTQPGDSLYVSGSIGDAALGLHLRWRHTNDLPWIDALDHDHREALLDRHRRPQPRLALRAALRDHARAAMDVSDGFVGDLNKMLRLEGLGATVALAGFPFSPAVRAALALEPRLAGTALSGGDDYEILCAVAPEKTAAFEASAHDAGIGVTRVGQATARDSGVEVADANGQRLELSTSSFQHFT